MQTFNHLFLILRLSHYLLFLIYLFCYLNWIKTGEEKEACFLSLKFLEYFILLKHVTFWIVQVQLKQKLYYKELQSISSCCLYVPWHTERIFSSGSMLAGSFCLSVVWGAPIPWMKDSSLCTEMLLKLCFLCDGPLQSSSWA